jgi:hypothetical protein
MASPVDRAPWKLSPGAKEVILLDISRQRSAMDGMRLSKDGNRVTLLRRISR